MVRENMRSPRAVLHFNLWGYDTSGWVVLVGRLDLGGAVSWQKYFRVGRWVELEYFRVGGWLRGRAGGRVGPGAHWPVLGRAPNRGDWVRVLQGGWAGWARG